MTTEFVIVHLTAKFSVDSEMGKRILEAEAAKQRDINEEGKTDEYVDYVKDYLFENVKDLFEQATVFTTKHWLDADIYSPDDDSDIPF